MWFSYHRQLITPIGAPSVHLYPRLEAEAELYTDDVVICQPPPGELQEDVFFGFESFVVAIFGGVYR